jgi:spore coat protein A, manganese oxidase
MSLKNLQPGKRQQDISLRIAIFLVVLLITIGIFAKNNWLPSTDPISGVRTGWFGSKSAPAPLSFAPTSTPQLSKEYIYAGSQLLAVEDANANAIYPSDLAIWRPSTGTWWVMGGAAGSQPTTQAWGASTDKPVPGDYDGDGKTDFSVFRPSTGEWYVLQSSDGAWSVWTWGLSTDVRVPADYDGDGKTDRAVWRPSDGFWYVVRSSDTVILYQPYGTNGDVPSPADYDGDGRADLAVWRNADQKFYFIGSADSRSVVVSMGQASTQPVSGDYDGDGKADHAIRNSANWIIRQSSNGQTVTVGWQKSADTAVQNDYDGDGKVDIAVWRSTNSPPGTLGNWFIRQSASGNSLRQVAWGTSGDWPVPALYRR